MYALYQRPERLNLQVVLYCFGIMHEARVRPHFAIVLVLSKQYPSGYSAVHNDTAGYSSARPVIHIRVYNTTCPSR